MPAISSNTSQWADVYALSGIPVGTGLLIQNQGNARAIMQQSATIPDPTDNTGRRVQIDDEVQVDAGAPGVWMRCSPGGVQAYVQAAS